MDAYIFLNRNESEDVIKKWCEYYGYGLRKKPDNRGYMDNYLDVHDNRSYYYYVTEEPDEPNNNTDSSTYLPYKINVDYNIYMDITVNNSDRTTIDMVNLFFSLAAFACKSTRSDMLVFFEDAVPLIHRHNDNVFIAERTVYHPNDNWMFAEALEFFKDIKYTIIDIDKYFGAW